MSGEPALETLAGIFTGLPQCMGRALLAFVCTRPDAPVPDALAQAASAEDPEGWIVQAAELAPVTGLLWHRLTPGQRRLFSAPVQAACAERYLLYTMRAEGRRRLLEDCLARLSGAGLPALLLKGSALVAEVYQAAVEREMCDLDLLVPDDRLGEAQELLARDAVRGPATEAVRHEAPLILPGNYASVELHGVRQHLATWPRTAAGDPFDAARPVQVGGQTAYCLASPDNWLHVACHAASHAVSRAPRLAADLARLQRSPHWHPDAWPRVWRAAAARGQGRTVALAAAMAGGGTLPAGLRELLPTAESADAERRARFVWRLAFDGREGWPLWVQLAWLGEGLGPEVLRVPTIDETRAKFRVPRALALVARPCFYAARVACRTAGVLRWRWFVREYR